LKKLFLSVSTAAVVSLGFTSTAVFASPNLEDVNNQVNAKAYQLKDESNMRTDEGQAKVNQTIDQAQVQSETIQEKANQGWEETKEKRNLIFEAFLPFLNQELSVMTNYLSESNENLKPALEATRKTTKKKVYRLKGENQIKKAVKETGKEVKNADDNKNLYRDTAQDQVQDTKEAVKEQQEVVEGVVSTIR
jgi:hypothetical protein